ncbi:MAG TPA: hypothetical protein PJ997_01320 [Candidatus Paceibacterota bacterium]|nr:hypothetical protein [Candidatus Paceibacterota bacterium]HMP18961.1 hypothetical protein [Candidatus Paceibacterota bacterium]HMP85574.1 hypothetical protein [Candidatus Paceibacterota bacterium]
MSLENQNQDQRIKIQDIEKIEIKIGQIKTAEKVENADKLLKLTVDFGDHQRQIVSGIAKYYPDPTILIGKKCPFFTNLEAREIRGLKSDGMILAAFDSVSESFSLLNVEDSISSGTKIF